MVTENVQNGQLAKHIYINDSKCFVLLRCPLNQCVHFQLKGGFLSTAVLFGHVQTEGFHMEPKDKLIHLFASEEHSLVFSVRHESRFDFDKLRERVNRWDVLGKVGKVLLKDEQSFAGSFALLVVRKDSLNKTKLILDYLNNFSEKEEKIEFKSMERNAFSVSQLWGETLTDFVDNHVQKNSVTMVCGGRNSGKSTLSRWLSNTLIQSKQFKHVYYLDLDPGQPEFGNCAQLTLTKISQAIITPPHINISKYHSEIIYSCSIGNVNVEDLSSVYTINLKRLWNQKMLPLINDGPTLVNTMGYVRTIGFMLLVDAIQIIRPTNLIEIRFEIPPNTRRIYEINYEKLLKPEIIQTCDGWLPKSTGLQLNYNYLQLENEFHLFKKKAYLNRISNQLGYFGGFKQLIHRPLSCVTPFKLDLDNLFVHINSGSEIPAHLALDIIVGGWIQLCVITPDPEYSDSNGFQSNVPLDQCFRLLNELPVNECLGCGIVYSIDVDQRCLHILSPEPEAKLSKINCIVKPGMMTMPFEILDKFSKYPWPCSEAFEKVFNIINKTDLIVADNVSETRLSELSWCWEQLFIWMNRFHSQHYQEISSTCSLLTCLCSELRYQLELQFNSGFSTDSDQPTHQNVSLIPPSRNQEFCKMYALTFQEFFKTLAFYEVTSTGKIAKTNSRLDSSVLRIAEKIKIPPYLVEYRHQIAHSSLPSFSNLKSACSIALEWLKEFYWNRILAEQIKDRKNSQENKDKLVTLINSSTCGRKRKHGSNSPNVKCCTSSELVAQMHKCFNSSPNSTLQLLVQNLVDALKDSVCSLKSSDLDKLLSEKFADHQPEVPVNCQINVIPQPVFDRYKRVLVYMRSLKQQDHLVSLLLGLVELFDDKDTGVRNAAIIWFAQIQVALLNSPAGCAASTVQQTQSGRKSVSKTSQCCAQPACICGFEFDERQKTSCKWTHIFIRLIDRPNTDALSVLLARHFRQLVQHLLGDETLDQIIKLSSVYAGSIQVVTSGCKQVFTVQDFESLEANTQINLG